MTHFQYLSWPDYGVPTSALTLIDFLGAVKRQQRQAVKGMGPQWRGHPLGPPMVVHCSAGIGRTGELFILADDHHSFSLCVSDFTPVLETKIKTHKIYYLGSVFCTIM